MSRAPISTFPPIRFAFIQSRRPKGRRTQAAADMRLTEAGQTRRCHWPRFPPSFSRRSCATSISSSAWRAWPTTRIGTTGGPRGRYVDYWHSQSFGELVASAHTRKAILERLIPRLKIASQCSFSDKFLVVKGQLRTYKIHLGSGNILMSPNDFALSRAHRLQRPTAQRCFSPLRAITLWRWSSARPSFWPKMPRLKTRRSTSRFGQLETLLRIFLIGNRVQKS